MKENDLKCYIVKDNKSKEDYYYNKFSDWEGEYVQNGELVYRKYKDPDTEESRSYEFYEKLTKFLNIQENSSKYQLKGKYTYKFNYTNPYGIEVREKSNDSRDMKKEIESGPLFYLKSDQFGFSRPSTEKKHPYDSYLEKSSYSETSKENVAKWLYETRRLGGSFLWPMEKMQTGHGIVIRNTIRKEEEQNQKGEARILKIGSILLYWRSSKLWTISDLITQN